MGFLNKQEIRRCEERFLRRSNPGFDFTAALNGSFYNTKLLFLKSKPGLLRRKKRSSQRRIFCLFRHPMNNYFAQSPIYELESQKLGNDI